MKINIRDLIGTDPIVTAFQSENKQYVLAQHKLIIQGMDHDYFSVIPLRNISGLMIPNKCLQIDLYDSGHDTLYMLNPGANPDGIRKLFVEISKRI